MYTQTSFILCCQSSELAPVRLGAKPLEATARIVFLLNTCCHSPSLKRGWVCLLHLLLALASTFILRSDSRGTRNHILLSQIRDSPNLEGQVPLFIYPRNKAAQLSPRTLGSLSVAFNDLQGYGGFSVASIWAPVV
jgi:hypothetical protein